MELQRSGFSEDEIRAARERAAAEQPRVHGPGAEGALHPRADRRGREDRGDARGLRREIELIAEQSGETPRRVRARLEKGGGMDVLRNQIIERKVIDLILAHAEFKEVPYEPETAEAEAVDRRPAASRNRRSRRSSPKAPSRSRRAAKPSRKAASSEAGKRANARPEGSEEQHDAWP